MTYFTFSACEERYYAQWFVNNDYPNGAHLAACQDEPSVNTQVTLSRSKGLIYPGDSQLSELTGRR